MRVRRHTAALIITSAVFAAGVVAPADAKPGNGNANGHGKGHCRAFHARGEGSDAGNGITAATIYRGNREIGTTLGTFDPPTVDAEGIASFAGTIVFILVFVPTLIAALDALKIEAISRPATDMLGRLLAAVPNLVAAALILVVTWYVAKFAADVLSRLLGGMGLDTVPERLGIGSAFKGTLKPSGLVRGLALFFAMLFATVEAADRLAFSQVRDLVALFIKFGGEVLLGGSILVIGFWLANLAHDAISRASERTGLARLARIAILGLVIAMGLRAMGIADDIVNLAFGLTLGAVAVAFALSFGLGGREAAGRQMEHWLSQLRKD